MSRFLTSKKQCYLELIHLWRLLFYSEYGHPSTQYVQKSFFVSMPFKLIIPFKPVEWHCHFSAVMYTRLCRYKYAVYPTEPYCLSKQNKHKIQGWGQVKN